MEAVQSLVKVSFSFSFSTVSGGGDGDSAGLLLLLLLLPPPPVVSIGDVHAMARAARLDSLVDRDGGRGDRLRCDGPKRGACRLKL